MLPFWLSFSSLQISIPQPSWGYFFNGRSPVILAASKGGWYGLILAKRLLNVLPTYLLLNIASISNLYDICGSNLYIMKYCVIYFECPPFDVFFSSFQTAIIFYIKRSFYSVLTSLTLSLNHKGFRVVFCIQKKTHLVSGFKEKLICLFWFMML